MLFIPTGDSAGKYPLHYGGGIFLKPFKTIEEQTEQLKERGLIIHDEDKAKNVLLSNNYYNIINGYSKYFPMQGDNYIGGSTFDEVLHLYLFDVELKQTFFRAILAAELHIKSIFAHRFAEHFTSINEPYLDANCYDPGNPLDVRRTIQKLRDIINARNNDSSSSIYHYKTTYNYVPIWVLVNYLDFGHIRHMLQNAPIQVQNKVAKDLLGFITQNISFTGFFPPQTMLAFLKNINEVRNVCAHNNRLIGFRCYADDKYLAPLHQTYNIMPNDSRRDAYSIYISLQCFLTKDEHHILHNTLRKRMNNVSNQLHTIDLNDILKELGFPNDWNKNVKKIVQQSQSTKSKTMRPTHYRYRDCRRRYRPWCSSPSQAKRAVSLLYRRQTRIEKDRPPR